LFLDEFTVRSQRLVGEKHLKLSLERGHQRFDAIWFGHASAQPHPGRLPAGPESLERRDHRAAGDRARSLTLCAAARSRLASLAFAQGIDNIYHWYFY